MLHYFKENRHLKGEELDAAIDSAFFALRELNNAASSALKLEEPTAQTEIIDVNVTRVNKVGPGVILVAHPAVRKNLYNRAILLITSHDERNHQYTSRVATRGLFLTENKNEDQEPFYVPEAVQLVQEQRESFARHFGGPVSITQVNPQHRKLQLKQEEEVRFNNLPENIKKISKQHFGGPVESVEGRTALFSSDILNVEARDKGIIRVSDRLFWTPDVRSIHALDSYLDEGRVKDEDCILYKGMTTWKAQQLQKEIDYNVWIMAKCDDVFTLLKQTNHDPHITYDVIMDKLGGEFSSWKNLGHKNN
ncbi:hypothetical protein AKO1_007352 [Acrasis kona]|uniref:Uncharacterized protein n=1 Tax=Acrasis kona TaxID=1008807 RepID=A0AAW2YUL3_9EUKA